MISVAILAQVSFFASSVRVFLLKKLCVVLFVMPRPAPDFSFPRRAFEWVDTHFKEGDVVLVAYGDDDGYPAKVDDIYFRRCAAGIIFLIWFTLSCMLRPLTQDALVKCNPFESQDHCGCSS